MSLEWAATELVGLVRRRYADWENCAHAAFAADEVAPLRAMAAQAQALLGRLEMARLIEAHQWSEVLGRIERIGRSASLLYTYGPHNDLNILHAPTLDKSRFCLQLYALLHDQTPIYDRFDDYLTFINQRDWPSKWIFPTSLLFALHPRNEVPVKPRLAQWLLRFMGAAETYTPAPSLGAYTAVRKNAHALKGALAATGPRDMADVFSVLAVAFEESQRLTGRLDLKGQVELDPPTAYTVTTGAAVLRERPTGPVDDASTDDASEDAASPDGASDVFDQAQLAEAVGYSAETITLWLRAVARKKQAIFYGPPGTGKTFVARRLARHLVAGGDGFVELVQFHPAYAYEDFVQGIRPKTDPVSGAVRYEMTPGRFVAFCRAAAQRRDRCVLIIDEINRADMARVLGELLYLLEYRNESVPLAGGGTLRIPDNVVVLGTMNTADRSIALVDHALRRRFAFVALRPNYAVLTRYLAQRNVAAGPLVQLLRRLNAEIEPDYQVGITYFLRENLAGELADIWQTEIEPYLEEYFYDRPEAVAPYRWSVVGRELGDSAESAP